MSDQSTGEPSNVRHMTTARARRNKETLDRLLSPPALPPTTPMPEAMRLGRIEQKLSELNRTFDDFHYRHARIIDSLEDFEGRLSELNGRLLSLVQHFRTVVDRLGLD